MVGKSAWAICGCHFFTGVSVVTGASRANC
jgi:hypothetical protein